MRRTSITTTIARHQVVATTPCFLVVPEYLQAVDVLDSATKLSRLIESLQGTVAAMLRKHGTWHSPR